MNKPSHLIITTEKAVALIEKYLTPHEDKFMTFLETEFPDVAIGCALMAGCLANQINSESKEMQPLKEALFNFVVEYVANKEHNENPNSQELN
jgi:hypothetical protein